MQQVTHAGTPAFFARQSCYMNSSVQLLLASVLERASEGGREGGGAVKHGPATVLV